MTGPVLELRDVIRIHGHDETAVHALDGVTLAVAAGELVAVMGRPARASRRCSTSPAGSTPPHPAT